MDDSFSFNHDFSAPLQRIKIGTVSAKVETSDERQETRDRVDEERRHQTDVCFSLFCSSAFFSFGCIYHKACIVRVMKDRKHMSHNDLINEVTRQLAGRFQPDPLNIKKRIENLIEVHLPAVPCKDKPTDFFRHSVNIWNDAKTENPIITWYVFLGRRPCGC